MKQLFILMMALTAMSFNSCTDNIRARNYGGQEEITLQPNEEFVNITWKEANLWIITQDTINGVYYAREKSSWGVWEGRIKIYSSTIKSTVKPTAMKGSDGDYGEIVFSNYNTTITSQ